MEQQNPNNTPDGSGGGGGGDVPLKRKRGRPRKYPRPDAEESSYIALNQSKMQNPPVRTDQHVPVPTRFNAAAVNGNQQQFQSVSNNNATVGQTVSGVIEAIFEAGYLLSVRVAGSDTHLRGLVFKPECYVPVSPQNDVAPGVPMIQRNEVPFPSGTTQFQTPPLNPKANNGQPVSGCKVETLAAMNNGLPQVPPMRTVNLVASSGNNFPSMAGAGQSTIDQLARRTVMPTTVLQPGNFSNGMPPVSNQQPSQVTPAVSIGSGGGVIAGKEVTAVYGNQEEATSSAQTTSQNMLPSSRLQTEGVSHYQSSDDALNGNEAKSPTTTKSLTAPPNVLHFEQLVTEVVRRIETPSDAMDTETTGNSKRGDNIMVKDPPSPMQEGKANNDMDQSSVLIKPLQAVQSPSDAMDTETGNSKPGDNILLVKDPIPNAGGLEDNKVNVMHPSVLNKKPLQAVQSPSDAMDIIETAHSKPDNMIPVKDRSTGQEGKVNDMDQSLLIAPLQAVKFHLQEESTSAPKDSDSTETSKMVQLLQNDNRKPGN